MKILILIAAIAAAPRAFALFGVGDVVYDPVNYGVLVETKAETLAQWATAIGKAETQIQNQLQQIQRAESLLNTQNTMLLSVGDWRGVVAKAQSIQLQAANLTHDNNSGMEASFVVADGQPSLGYTNHGNFAGLTPTDPFGAAVTVPEPQLRRYAGVESVYEKSLTTLQASEAEAMANNQEIADTYQAMTVTGITQQEYGKLQGKLEALSVRQQALQAQRQEALSMVQAERAINENQEAKEATVGRQVQESGNDQIVSQLAQTQFDVLTWQ